MAITERMKKRPTEWINLKSTQSKTQKKKRKRNRKKEKNAQEELKQAKHKQRMLRMFSHEEMFI